jgi:hypothetical protein
MDVSSDTQQTRAFTPRFSHGVCISHFYKNMEFPQSRSGFYFLTGAIGFLVRATLVLSQQNSGIARFMFWTAVLTAIMLAIGSVATIPWILFSALLFVEVFATMREPAFSHIINHHVESGVALQRSRT